MCVKYSTVPMISHPDLTAMDLLVWGALCSYATWEWESNDDGKREPRRGTCYPGRTKLACRALCHIKTVTRAIKNLEEMGFISYSRTPCGNGWKANHYTLNPIPINRGKKESRDSQSLGTYSPEDSQSLVVGTDSPECRDSQSLVVGTDSPTNNTIRTIPRIGEREQCLPAAELPTATEGESPELSPDSQGPDTSPTLEPPQHQEAITDKTPLTSEDVDRMFNFIWERYPNHQYEGAARKIFHKLIPKGTLYAAAAQILDDIKRRMEEDAPRWAGPEGESQFAPRLSKWLEESYGIE